MARSLPLSPLTPEQLTAAEERAEPAGSALRGTVAVFDPALCCATGVCGPGVDPALLAIARDLRWLEAQGVTVARTGLSQEPQAFVANAAVSGLLQTFGDGALPAVLVNDTVLCHGRYPTRDELLAVLGT
ncbi:MAG: arsenite efflux transporter metallochaperone ArsD [Gemmatimonadaceae bacterium]|nr:arsenite efflux transporter metallochaperone ArsD [Gemmatimonadaceae bacterium]